MSTRIFLIYFIFFTQCINAVNIHEGNREFTIVNAEETQTILGNLQTIGNTVTCITNSTNSYGTCIEGFNTNTDNERYVKYVNIENPNNINGTATINVNGSNTVIYNASSAELNITTPTAGTVYEVVWAGLFWQGSLNNWSNSNRFFHNYLPYTIDLSEFDQFHQDEILLHFPTMQDKEYVKVKLSDNDYYDYYNVYREDYGGRTRNGGVYAAFADITSYFRNYGDVHNPNGIYKIANLKTVEGHESNLGNYGGWSLVVVYKNATDPLEKLRSIAVYSGYQVISAVHNTQAEIPISGFLTPKYGEVNTTISIFTGEAERYSGDYSKLVTPKTGPDGEYLNDGLTPDNNLYQGRISGKTANLRDPNFYNTNGIDIRNFDVSHLMTNDQTSATIKIGTQGDTYFPSMVTFNTQLFMPKFCYDYSYKQFGRYFTEDVNATQPRIRGDVIPGYPVDVALYIRNNEISDVRAEDLEITIYDINTSQAKYIENTTYITKPGDVSKTPYPDDPETTESKIANIDIGTVDAQEYFYIYYSLNPIIPNLSIPIYAKMRYSLYITLPNSEDVVIDNYTSELTQMPPCVTTDVPYEPMYGIFNIQHLSLDNQYYNLPTEVVNRGDSLKIVAFDDENLEQPEDINFSTHVAIELFNVNAFHDLNASCEERSNKIGTRWWVRFPKNQTYTEINPDTVLNGLTSTAQIFSSAIKNAGFRISFLRNNEGQPVETELMPSGRWKLTNFTTYAGQKCLSDIDGNPNSTDTVPQYCGDNGEGQGNNGMNDAELHTCLQCIYGYNTVSYCSRDNFSIRPENFYINISDIDQVTKSKLGDITNNNSSSVPSVQLSSGYKYSIDINATKFNTLEPAPGYTRLYKSTSTDHNVSLVWSPPSAAYNSACNVIDSKHLDASFMIYHGTTHTPWGQDINFSSNDIGIYRLNMIDSSWTAVDQNPAHHQGNAHFHLWDCKQDSNLIQDTSTLLSYTDVLNGCIINTENYNGETYAFNDINITFRPYKFVLSITRSHGTDFDTDFTNAWLYYADVSESTDSLEAYHAVGTITAVGYDNGRNNNFVNGCFATDLNISLDHIIEENPLESALQIRFIDKNDTDTFTDEVIDINHSSKILELDTSNFPKSGVGQTSFRLHLNFERSYNIPLNPNRVKITDLNATCTNVNECLSYADGSSDHEAKGNDYAENNITFYYGRLHAPDYRTYQNSINTPIYAEIFCDLNDSLKNKYGILNWNESVDSANWWVNPHHNGSIDGNVTNLAAKVGFTDEADDSITIDHNSTNVVTNGIFTEPTIIYTGSTKPHKTQIRIGTQSWLKYHRFINDVNKMLYYNVEFLGQGGWAGIGVKGSTLHEVNGTSERIEW